MQKNYEDDADDQIEDISRCALEPLSRYRNFHPPWISPHEYLRPIGHILSDDDYNEDEYFQVTGLNVDNNDNDNDEYDLSFEFHIICWREALENPPTTVFDHLTI